MEASLAKAGIELKVQVHEFNAWSEKVDIQGTLCLNYKVVLWDQTQLHFKND